MDNIIFASVLISVFLILYHHIGYPVLLNIVRILKKKEPEIEVVPLHYSPIKNSDDTHHNISIIIPAYNEEKYIAEKLYNLSCLDYPLDSFSIIVACDGCTDNTVSIAEKVALTLRKRGLNIDILNFAENRGKCELLNNVIKHIKTELVAFSDVSSLVSVDALNIGSHKFKDSKVGAINGNYRMLNPGNAGESAYWKYQKKIKRGEESLGSILGAHGAFYMLRTRLFRDDLISGTINDDFVIPMRVIEQGYKVLYDERINAVELENTDNEQNWKRRKRIGFGNAQQLFMLRALMKPKYGGVAFAFFSGKCLRVLMPFIMIYCFLSSLYCALIWPLLIPIVTIQAALYLVTLMVELRKGKGLGKTANMVHYLVSSHAANLIGTLNYISRSKTEW